MKLFLLAILFVGLAIMGLAIKMFFLKDGKFTKTCGSVDPKTGKKIACTCGSNENENRSHCDNKND